jgi:DNA-binding response OmpR family regulator
MYKILTISRNASLLFQRNDTLAMNGFRVISPRCPEEASALALEQDVDAVVIAHSVEPLSRAHVIQALRQACPKCLIIFLYAHPETGREPLADISLDLTQGPEPLIAALRERLPRASAA